MTEVETETSSSVVTTQTTSTEPPVEQPQTPGTSVPSSGRRLAFRDIRRQLTDTELSSTGVQKLLLEMLEEADVNCDHLQPYVELYHEADKRAAILGEQLKTPRRIEIFFGVGVGLGGAIIGLTPFFGEIKSEYGWNTAIIGLLLVGGATVGRIAKI